jgi:outer membrane protein assembly factor BamB
LPGQLHLFYLAATAIPSSPAVAAEGTIYVGSDDQNFYGLSPDGTMLYSLAAGGIFMGASPAIGPDGTVYIGSGDGYLYAIHGGGALADSPWPEFRHDALHTGRVPAQGPPRFLTQPTSQTVAVGSNVTFTASATGALPLSYQWQRNGTTLSDGGDVAGATTPVLTLDNVQTAQAGSYTVVVANAAGTNVSQAATLQVIGGFVPPGTLQWTFDTSGNVATAPTIGPDGAVYFGSADTNFYAVNPDGSMKWSFQAGAAIESPAALGPDGTVYFGAKDSKLYAVGPDGKLRWTLGPIRLSGACPAIGSDGTIYAAGNGDLYALRPDGATNWVFALGSAYHSSPVVGFDGTIYVGSGHPDLTYGYEAGDLYALNPDGSVKWDFSARGPFQAAPAIGADGTIYFGSFDNAGKVYALDRQGNEKWEFATGAAIGNAPILGPDGAIYIASMGTLVALNPDGTKRWSLATGNINRNSTAALDADGTLYIGAMDGNLYAVGTNGVVRWTYYVERGDNGYSAPAIGANGVVYFGALTNLYAIQGGAGPADSAWPLFQHDAQHTGRVPGSTAFPFAVITSPTNGATFTPGQHVPLQARAFGGTGSITNVSFFAGTNLLGSATTAPYSLTWSNVASGLYTLTAVATDQDGVTGTSGPVHILVNAAPTVSMISPTNGAAFTEYDSVWLQAEAADSDGSVAQVDFYQGTNFLGSVTQPPYSLLLTNMAPGRYVFSATATDDEGATGASAPVALFVNALPSVAITSPSNHAQFAAAAPITITAAATDADGSVARVDFYDGFSWLGSATNAPFTLTVTNLVSGDHALLAVATDNLGAMAVSPAIAVSVTPPLFAPQLSFDAPFPGALYVLPASIRLLASATDLGGQVTQVLFYANQEPLAAIPGTNSLSFVWTNPPAGNYLLAAQAIDTLGATTVLTRSISVVDTNHIPAAPLLAAANANTNFWAPDGPVYATAETNGVLYVGGAFSHIGQSVPGNAVIDISSPSPDLSYPLVDGGIDVILDDGAGGYYLGGGFDAVGGIARTNLAHVLPDKSVDLNWAPSANGPVVTMGLLGKTLYIGGEFTTVSGQPQPYLAALDANTGHLLDWKPGVGGELTALTVTNQTVYFGGFFYTVGIRSRNHFAAVDASTAALTPWNPNADNYPLQLTAANGLIYAAGRFSQLNGQAHSSFAALDPTTGQATDWNPNPEGAVETFVIDGDVAYAGGMFGRIGGSARANLAAVDLNTGLATDWNPGADGEVSTMAILGDTVYVAGNFHNVAGQPRFRLAGLDRNSGQVTSFDLNDTGRLWDLAPVAAKILGGGSIGLIQLPKQGLAAFDEATGAAIDWDAQCDGEVDALAIKDNTLLVAGQFSSLGGQARSSIGAIDLGTARATDWNPGPGGGVNALAVSGNTVYLAGSFTAVGNFPRNHLAAIDLSTAQVLPWNPDANDTVNAMSVVSNLVYVGGQFTSVGGRPRSHLAALNLFTGEPTSWNPGADGLVLAMQAGGGLVYAGGYFNEAGGEPRNNLAALDAATGRASDWRADADGTVEALQLGDNVLYAAGQFANIGGQPRANLAALDLRFSVTNALPWNPGPGRGDPGSIVFCLDLTPSTLYVGGRFTTLNGGAEPYLATFDLPAHVESALHLPNGLFQLNLVGPLGHYYIFEASTNLEDWTPIFTNRAPFVFEDLESLNYSNRFYRAVPAH